MSKKKYVLVDMDVLPEVFLRVMRAKELLANGEAKNVSLAARMADVSRSAFYKYKDCIFYADAGQETITISATVLDEPGALQALLGGISAAGGSVVTINQSTPEDGIAQVSLTVRTDMMRIEVQTLCEELKKQRTLVEIRSR